MTVRRSRFDRTPAMAKGHLGVGSVLSRAFSIWGKNVLPFAVLSLIAFSPILLYTLLLLGSTVDGRAFSTWSQVETWGTVLLNLLVTGAVVYGVVQELRGRRAGVGPCISTGFGRMPAVIGVTILLWLYLIAAAIAVFFFGAFVLGIVGAMLGLGPKAAAILILAAYGSLAIWIFSMFWVAVPVCVVEKPGVSASLGKSNRLTNGHKWKILAIQLVFFLIGFVVNFAVRRTFMPESAEWGVQDPDIVVLLSGQGNVKTYMVLTLLISAVTGSLGAVASAVGYHDLRTSKEGVGIEELAKVFE